MAERRHRATIYQTHVGASFDPVNESVSRKFRPPSDTTHDWLQQQFAQMPQTGIRTDPAEEDHFAARSKHSSSAASGFGTVEIT